MSTFCLPCAHLVPTLCPPCAHLVPTFFPPCVNLSLDCILCIIVDFNNHFFRKEIQDHFVQKQNLDIEAFSNDYPYSTPFCDLLMYAKGLEFDEKPDYTKMRTKLKEWYENLKGKSKT